MYSFFDETVLRLDLPLDNSTLPRILLFYKEGVSVEGHKGILDCKPNEIVFRMGKDKVKVVGTDMKVESITSDQLFIRGRIISVGTVENE